MSSSRSGPVRGASAARYRRRRGPHGAPAQLGGDEVVDWAQRRIGAGARDNRRQAQQDLPLVQRLGVALEDRR